MNEQYEITTNKNDNAVYKNVPNETSAQKQSAKPEGTTPAEQEWSWQDSGVEMGF